MGATTEQIRASLTFSEQNPSRQIPRIAARIALIALDSGREFTPTCKHLSCWGVAGIMRGDDGVAYLAIPCNCGEDFAYLALTEGEANALRIPSLEAQKDKAAAYKAKLAADAETNREFNRMLDL